MMGRTHGAAGLVVGATLALANVGPWQDNITLHMVGLAVAGLAALTPDLDAEDSLIQELPMAEGRRSGRRAAREGFVGILLAIVLYLLGFLLTVFMKLASWVTRRFTKHREGTHKLLSPVVGAVITLALVFLTLGGAQLVLARINHQALSVAQAASQLFSGDVWWPTLYLMLCAALGWGSHLFLDALTPSGIPWPWGKEHRLHLGSIRTDSRTDKAIGTVGGLVFGGLLVLYGLRLGVSQGWWRADGWWHWLE